MSVIKISELKRGTVFYEIEQKVAVKWVAIEDAFYSKGSYRCSCLRKNGVVIEFMENQENQRTKYCTDVDEKEFMVG